MSEIQKSLEAAILKFDESNRTVFGWGIVSTIDGQPYVDSQNDYIGEEAMMKAAVEFMKGDRVAKMQHTGEPIGRVTVYPLTADIAKALGIQTQKTGMLASVHVESDEVLQKFRSGELKGFSIGGKALQYEQVSA